MGTFQEWKCGNCGYVVCMGDFIEFYRNEKGEIKIYGHPVPCSEEARRCGIAGFLTERYCPQLKNC